MADIEKKAQQVENIDTHKHKSLFIEKMRGIEKKAQQGENIDTHQLESLFCTTMIIF